MRTTILCAREDNIFRICKIFFKAITSLVADCRAYSTCNFGNQKNTDEEEAAQTNSPVPLALFIFHILRHVLQKVQSSTSRGYMIDDSCIAVGQGSRQQVRRASVAGGLYRVLQFFLFTSNHWRNEQKKEESCPVCSYIRAGQSH